ncbi:MAG: YdcF family protein [Rhodocyclaceae bacterium]|nr:YdcF family protein [Rhodocyclaceae bacterium]
MKEELLLFGFKKLVSALVLPPFLPWFLVLGGLALWQRSRRVAWALILIGAAAGWFFSVRVAVDWLAHPLEEIPPLNQQSLAHAEAIVILGAGQRRWLPEYQGPAPTGVGLERLRYGARLAKQSGLPVLVTGGAPTGGAAEAQTMAAALQEDFGLRPQWIEDQALDTRDNAKNSAAILMPLGIRRIVLVTHAVHMRRAVNEFEAVGFEVMPAPTGYFSRGGAESALHDWLPSASAAFWAALTAHEWLGLVAQSLRRFLF